MARSYGYIHNGVEPTTDTGGICVKELGLLMVCIGSTALSACERPASGSGPCGSSTTCPMRLLPDAATYSTALSARERAGQWQSARRLLHDMPDRRLPPDTITRSTAISACERAGQWRLAGRPFHDMPGGACCDTVTGSTAVGACEKVGQRQPALRLLCGSAGLALPRGLAA